MSIETLTVALAAIASGIIAGILFSKLMIMFLYRIINIKAQINFTVSTSAVVNTILIFGVLYFLTLIYNLMQVKLANPIELLRGGNVGEKEPKSKWFIAIIGLLCLAGGYYIAITTKNPLQVLSLFFVAVLLVIIGTYFLFISGSIVILKALRKIKASTITKAFCSGFRNDLQNEAECGRTSEYMCAFHHGTGCCFHNREHVCGHGGRA